MTPNQKKFLEAYEVVKNALPAFETLKTLLPVVEAETIIPFSGSVGAAPKKVKKKPRLSDIEIKRIVAKRISGN